MNTFNKILGYGGCLMGAIAMMLFVVIPGFLFTFFPSYANNLSDSLELWQKQNHAEIASIMQIVGPLLTIFFVVGIPVIATSPLWLTYINDRRKISILKKHGQKGQAKILAIEDTGITINRNPYARLTLEIQHTKVQMNVAVSRLDIPEVGDSISIVYDPSNPEIAVPAYKMP